MDIEGYEFDLIKSNLDIFKAKKTYLLLLSYIQIVISKIR